MSSKLRQFLAASGVDADLAREIRWADAVMLQNYGAIPPAVGKSGHYVWNRGFNLLLLGRGGAPRYFCKCRPTADHNLEREPRCCRRCSAIRSSAASCRALTAGAAVTCRA